MPAVHLWRIAKATKAYAADDLTGRGAARVGGRWNSKGNAVVYAASSIALACLETLVHVGDSIAVRNQFLVRVDLPDEVWKRRQVRLPSDIDPTWLAEPPAASSVAVGDAWLASLESALLAVPSVVVPEEANVLINPGHPDAQLITATVVRQFVYDPRL